MFLKSNHIYSGHLEKLVNSGLKKTCGLAEKAVEDFLSEWLKNNEEFKGHVFSVGGYPRDKLWGIDSDDLDLIVDISGGEGARKLTQVLFNEFGNNKLSHPIQQRNYPIWKMSFKDNIEYKGKIYNTKGADIDFADPQKESFPDESSRQRVTTPGTLEEDALRRDLTINTLMQDLTSQEFVDLTGYAKDDILDGTVRINPKVDWNKILSEDPLRMLRAIRFFSVKPQLKRFDKAMLDAIKRNASQIEKVSSERIMEELKKTMKAGKLNDTMSMMQITGLLQYIFPELQSLIDTQHDMGYTHQEGSIWAHTLLVLKNAPPTIEGQLAALLHDVGKPQTKKEIDGKFHFYGHDKASGELTEAILRRMKMDGDTIEKVRKLVDTHMRAPNSLYDKDLSTKQATKVLRRYIRDMGDLLEEALALAEADHLGTFPVGPNPIPGIRDRIKQLQEETPVVQKKPVLDGFRIMNILGIDPKKDKNRLPEVGRVTKFILDLMDGDPTITKEEVTSKVIAAKDSFKENINLSNNKFRDNLMKLT
ncbi:MAG: HD domain-containing protein [Nanoarchaeota archaeon]